MAKAEIWQDPTTNINYLYTPGTLSAAVTDSPDAVDANILSTITVDNNTYIVDRIISWSFRLNQNLQNAIIPSSIETIGDQAFANCYNLKTVTFSEGLKNIEDAAFHYCTSLEVIHIPASVKICGDFFDISPFRGCRNLTEITVDENNTEYDSRNNCNAIIKKSDNKLIQGCRNTVIPNDVKTIGNCAFEYCERLTSINIPSNVEKVMSMAFEDCYDLTYITLNEGLREIFNSAFAGCKEATEITIPKSVTSIGTCAFGPSSRYYNGEPIYCEKLKKITVLWDVPLQIDESVFMDGNYKNATLYVPVGTKEKYRNATG